VLRRRGTKNLGFFDWDENSGIEFKALLKTKRKQRGRRGEKEKRRLEVDW
jgi:hypothetical protein